MWLGILYTWLFPQGNGKLKRPPVLDGEGAELLAIGQSRQEEASWLLLGKLFGKAALQASAVADGPAQALNYPLNWVLLPVLTP